MKQRNCLHNNQIFLAYNHKPSHKSPPISQCLYLHASSLSLLFSVSQLHLLKDSGVVSVAVSNATLLNGEVAGYQQEFAEFNYETIEWNNDVANSENEWRFEEAGVGEFELTDQFGDAVIIQAHNDNDLNGDLGAILGTIVGGANTVASNIGNSISIAQQDVQDTTTTNVKKAEDIADHVDSATRNVAGDVQSLSEGAIQVTENLYNESVNNIQSLSENTAQAAQDATQSAQNTANQVRSSTINAANSVENTVQNAATEAATNIQNASQDATNYASETYNSASDSLQNGVNSVQNSLNSIGNAYN